MVHKEPHENVALEEHLKCNVLYKIQCTQVTTNLPILWGDSEFPNAALRPSRPGLERVDTAVCAADHWKEARGTLTGLRTLTKEKETEKQYVSFPIIVPKKL